MKDNVIMASDNPKERGGSYEENKAARATARRKAEVAAWLGRKPHIGALNGGSYYKFENGQQVSVKELDEKA